MATSSETHWFTRRAGQVRGPYPREALSRYILLGRIGERDELSQDRQTWQSLHHYPELIPTVMRDVRTAEDVCRLEQARRQVDERQCQDRRQTRRMAPGQIERRRADRRRPPPETSTITPFHATPQSPSRPFLPLMAGIVIVSVVLYFGFIR